MIDLKYPILMVHGMGFRDRKHIGYWGRIPRVLEGLGATVYFGGQDSSGSIEGNGEFLAQRIRELCAEHNIEKFNVIAHSKGGLDIRYAISSLGMGPRIASVTTINTPHNGSYTVDKLLKFPACIVRFGCVFADWWFRLLGDKNPRTYAAIRSFRTYDSQEFNRMNPDDPSVYYQSYAFTCKKVTGDMLLFISNLVVRAIEGENDGLLTPRAVKWTNFRGHFRSVGNRGVSHCDEVDMRRRPLSKKKGDGISDITDFYSDVVKELAQMGY